MAYLAIAMDFASCARACCPAKASSLILVLIKPLAFANLIQNGLPELASQTEQKDIDTIKPAFKILLENLTPKKVVVLSKRMWDRWLPTENCKRIKDITVNEKSADIWEYQYTDVSCYAMSIIHPTRMFGEQYKEWAPLVNEFLAM